MFTSAGAAFASTEVTKGCSDQVAIAIVAHHLTPARASSPPPPLTDLTP